MLESLFQPNTIAVIGDADNPGEPVELLVEHILEGGFVGEVLPVSPGVTQVAGIRCHGSLDAYKGRIDLCLVASSGERVVDDVKHALEAKARNIAVFAQSPAGEEGDRLRAQLKRLCMDSNRRMIGPGTVGIMDPGAGLNASLLPKPNKAGGVSIVSQSGSVCAAALDWLDGSGLGLSKLVDLGEAADMGESEVLGLLAEDPRTKVVTGYLEAIASGDRFLRKAEALALAKPVVFLKAGTTTTGNRCAAEVQSIERIGSDLAYGAAFKRSGVIRAEVLEELADIPMAFTMQPLPEGRSVGIVSNSGGATVLAADAIERAELSLGPTVMVGTDPSVVWDLSEEVSRGLGALEGKDNVDAAVVVVTPHSGTWSKEQEESLPIKLKEAAGKSEKPLMAAVIGGTGTAGLLRSLKDVGIPAYPSVEKAVRAIGAMWQYTSWKRRPPRIVTHFPVNKRRVERILNRHTKTGTVEVGEHPSKEILTAYGFNIPDSRVCVDSDEAVEAAERIGYPVAMKVVSPDILRKSAVDGVRMDLYTASQIRDAFDLMVLRVGRKAPSARIEGICVEKMCHRGREVILGMNRDPQFGPMLMFGLGGIFVEVMKDITFHLAPITADEAMQMLSQTRSFDSLNDDDKDRVNIPAIAAGLQRISQLATDFKQIRELEINPFMVGELELDAVVVDAKMILNRGRDKDD